MRSSRPLPRTPYADVVRAVTPRDTTLPPALALLIESEIIPRLLVAHGRCPQVSPADAGDTVSADEVAAFAPLSLQLEADDLIGHVDAMIARGVSLDTLLVDLLAPAARLLGQFWEDDRCDFVDVTMGLWRLQEVVHDLSARMPMPVSFDRTERRALFASMPGDQHSFGTVVLDELFGRDGWATERLSEATVDDLVGQVGRHWYDLVGLTISCDCHIAPLPALVAALRGASRNPRMQVMVGGRVFGGNPALAVDVGADGTAPDARQAVRVARALVDTAMREAVPAYG